MKHLGCILEFTSQRNKELMCAYRNAIKDKPFIDISEIAEIVVNSPCSRFWVSEERATIVISNMLKGRPVLNSMRPSKREMFLEIYHRVLALRKERPGDSLYNIVFLVVNSPAPKFYLHPRCAIEYIYKIKKSRHKNG